jgi:hypothetical protein
VGDAEHGRFVVPPPGDLKAERQALAVEAAGYRDRRLAGDVERRAVATGQAGKGTTGMAITSTRRMTAW